MCIRDSCWGGRTTLMYAAHNPGVKAAVAWYGPVARSYHPGDKTALDVAGRIKAAVLGLYGAADGGIPNDTVEKMRDALRAAGNTRSELVLLSLIHIWSAASSNTRVCCISAGGLARMTKSCTSAAPTG